MQTSEGKGHSYGFQSREAQDFPPTVILENTSVCNLRCIHCPQGQGFPEHPDYRPIYMDWDVYRKVIDEVAENRITVLRFAPEGEPTVHPRFLDQIAYAKAKGVRPVNLTTNGLTLDNPAIENGRRVPGKTILDRLLELGLDIMDISLDAFSRERYEKIRVWSNYHRVWSNVHRLLYLRKKMEHPIKLMLSIIDQPESHDEVDAFVKYWTPLVDRVIVRSYQTNLGFTPHKPGTGAERVGGIKRWPCTQFWKRVSIDPEGNILFCTVDWFARTNLGNVRTHAIKDVWQGAEYERMRKAHLEGRFAEAHRVCGPCQDWTAMRWDWGFDVAIGAVLGSQDVPSEPPPLEPAATAAP